MCMVFAPLLTWRHVKVSNQRTAVDWAGGRKDLVASHFPAAERSVVVQDNLHTQTPAALDAAFPPQAAQRLWDRWEFPYTPQHGSWFNMAAIALSVLSRQCLNRRIPSQPALQQDVAAWEARRNGNQATVHWQFTTADARGKLKKLYPVLKPSD
jgi:DDE superfamily endonuclease